MLDKYMEGILSASGRCKKFIKKTNETYTSIPDTASKTQISDSYCILLLLLLPQISKCAILSFSRSLADLETNVSELEKIYDELMGFKADGDTVGFDDKPIVSTIIAK